MKRFLCLLLALSCLAATPKTRDIVTRSGQVYTKAEVTKITPAGISITYPDGVAFIEFYDLSPELQKEFGFNSEAYLAVKRAEIQQNIEQQRTAQAMAEQQRAAAERDAEALRLQAAKASLQHRNYGDRGYEANTYSDRNYAGGYAPAATPTPAPSVESGGYSSGGYGGGSGTVPVRGYFRKDGTYVHSYTRRK